MKRTIQLSVPAPGTYRVSLAVADSPQLVVARRPVRVTPPAGVD